MPVDAVAALADPVRRDLVSRLAAGPARLEERRTVHERRSLAANPTSTTTTTTTTTTTEETA